MAMWIMVYVDIIKQSKLGETSSDNIKENLHHLPHSWYLSMNTQKSPNMWGEKIAAWQKKTNISRKTDPRGSKDNLRNFEQTVLISMFRWIQELISIKKWNKMTKIEKEELLEIKDSLSKNSIERLGKNEIRILNRKYSKQGKWWK